jgi:protein CpxP
LQRLMTAAAFAFIFAGAAAAQPASLQLARLHDALRLTSDQEPAWRAYAAAIAPGPAAEARHRQAEQLLPELPTPRRIALIEATMAADQADFHRQGLAVTRFYEQLSPAQQRIFDGETLAKPGQGGAGGGPGAALKAPPHS